MSPAACARLVCAWLVLTVGQPAGGQITGMVVAAEPGQALVRGAVIEVRAIQTGVRRTTVSDTRGRFAVRGLASGRYAVVASKPGWLRSGYDALAPGREGRPVSLTTAQPDASIVMSLVRGGVIDGVVRGPRGRPLRDLAVSAIRVDASGPVQTSYSDDQGAYRLFGLLPGDYLVVAVMSGFGGLQPVERLDRVGGMVSAPIYHPGVAARGDATRLRVRAGEETRGVDFVVDTVPAGTVSGSVTVEGGVAVGAIDVRLLPFGPQVPVLNAAEPRVAGEPGPDGAYRFIGVVSGRYLLVARAADRAGVARADWWADAVVETTGGDVVASSLTLRPLPRVSGSVVVSGAGIASARPLPSRVRLLRDAHDDWPAAASVVTEVPCALTGQHVDCGRVPPGPYRLELPGVADGWYIDSVSVAGATDADGRLVIGAIASPLTVMLTDRMGGVSGIFEMPAGRDAAAYDVVVFPSDPALWRAGSRRIASTRLADDGAFDLPGLPDGEYVVAAATGLSPEDLGDRLLLEHLRAAGTGVSVVNRQTATVRIRVTGPGR